MATESLIFILVKKSSPKYKFKIENLCDEKIYQKTFYSRGFVELKNPLRFSKYYYKKNFDLLTNCDVKTLDEIKNKNSIYFKVGNKNYRIYSKKIIICAGAVESCMLILNSLKDKKLKKLKNKKYLGRYFMDHPKCYVGELKYPKEKLIDVFKLKFKKRYNTYKGLSLFQKKKKTLNTYVRFEEKKVFFKLRKKFLIRIFLEMEPKYQNRIYIKNNSANVNLSINKNEIKISNKLLNFIKDFFSKSPKLEKLSIKATDLFDASHHMGGLCYPKNVDKNLKIQGLKNIYCCSSAIFPTSGSVNPTLIICALAERLSKILK